MPKRVPCKFAGCEERSVPGGFYCGDHPRGRAKNPTSVEAHARPANITDLPLFHDDRGPRELAQEVLREIATNKFASDYARVQAAQSLLKDAEPEKKDDPINLSAAHMAQQADFLGIAWPPQAEA